MPKKAIIVDGLLSELPFKEVLDWATFQTFCADVLFSRNGISDAREYLGQGSTQDGIDIYAVASVGERLISAQCKLENYLGPQALQDLVDLFINGEFATRSREFILCTNFDLGRQREHEHNLAIARDKLAQIGVSFIVWDKKGLSLELRNHPAPELVCRYFGQDIAKAFYGDIYKVWFRSIRPISKPLYESDPNYVTRRLMTYQDHLVSGTDSYRIFLKKPFVELVPLLARKDHSNNKFVVLSTAGYGKTIELEHAAAWFTREEEYLFPVKSYLCDYEGQSITELLDLHQPAWHELPEDALLLVFDGLDEIRESYFRSFINHLNQFSQARPKAAIVISSRFNFYDLVSNPLRGFDVLVLQPFGQGDIQAYIARNLPHRTYEFDRKVRSARFKDFLESPYYLARLVRFFRDRPEDFPLDRSELFEKILFERFDTDNKKKGDLMLRSAFFKVAQQVAYTMTRLGSSVMTSEQMMELLRDQKQIELLKNFFLLNKNAAAPDIWSFEHKNLQEHLSAKVIEQLPLEGIRDLVTYPYDRTRVQPHFVNTISFLFLNIDRNSKTFGELLQWLTEEQEELLVRFERERILPSTRSELFKKILIRYHTQNKHLYSSSGFSLEELMDFVHSDNKMIAHLDRMIMVDSSGWYAFNGADLLARYKKPFIYALQLKDIFLKILSGNFDDMVKVNALHALGRLEITDSAFFDQILALPLNMALRDIRQSLISLSYGEPFMEDHIDLLIESLIFFGHQDDQMDMNGSAEFLKSMLLKVEGSISVRKFMVYALSDPDATSLENGDKARINASEFKSILEKGGALFPDDPELVELVFQFYHGAHAVSVYADWLDPILQFFSRHEGLARQFHRVYNNNPADQQLMPLAEETTCDFLIEEYRSRKIGRAQMVIYQNVLSHVNYPLFHYFYTALIREFGMEFDIPDINFDYHAHWTSYIQKNQAMLLDRSMYLKELSDIFAELGLKSVTKAELYKYDNYKLRPFQHSIVLEMLKRESEKVPLEQAYFEGLIDGPRWELHKIDEFYRLYDQKTTTGERYIEPELMSFATDWLHNRIAQLDFTHSVQDSMDGKIVFNRNVEFVCRLYLRVRPAMSDDELLKILPADFHGGIETLEQSLAGLVMAQVQDRYKLRLSIMSYLRMGLATYVQKTLFTLCRRLEYSECLLLLYRFIRDNRVLTGNDRCNLTGYYLELGGDIYDFEDKLVAPPYEMAVNDISWEWYLLDKFMKIEPQAVADLMVGVLADNNRSAYHQMTAAHNLINLDHIEGLRYWCERTMTLRVSAFENIIDPIPAHILKMDIDAVLDLLLPLISSFVGPEAHLQRRRLRQGISDYVTDLLLLIVKTHPRTYTRISTALKGFTASQQDETALGWLKRYIDEITEAYQVVSLPEPTIADIRIELAQISSAC